MDIATQTLLFYPIVIALGFRTVYTDLKFKKIYNKDLIIAAFGGSVVYAYLIVTQQVKLEPLLFLINISIAITAALILFYSGSWGGGDAKLFITFSYLSPVTTRVNHFSFPSSNLFFCVFILSTLILTVQTFKKIIPREKKQFLLTIREKILKRIYRRFVIILCISWLPGVLMRLKGIPQSPILVFIITYLSYFLASVVLKKINKKILYAFLFLSIILNILLLKNYTVIFMSGIRYIKIGVIYAIIFYFIDSAIEINKKNDRNMVFAPIIFTGAIFSNTEFLNMFMSILNSFRTIL